MFRNFCTLTRAYSLPISIISWLVPFLYACFNKGNIIFGLMALIGIVVLHLATNLFDDIIDYSRELIDIKKGLKQTFNFQQGKCICIIENKISLKQAFIIDLILFSIGMAIGIFFFTIIGNKLLYIILPSAILCLLYPILGCMGFGELIVAIIFSPLLYSGVYLVMAGGFSAEIIMLSVSTGLLSVAVLFNHSLLDYKYDTTNHKITLCRLCKTEKNALFLLGIMIAFAFLNLLFWVQTGNLNLLYLLPFLTLPLAIKLIKEMNIYINQNKAPDNAQNFLSKFMLAQNLQKYFTIILCLAIILSMGFKF